MNLYNYDAVSKVYVSTTVARLDILESEKQNRDVWLIPANSTLVPVLDPQEGKAVVFDEDTQTWNYVDNFIGTDYWDAEGNKHTITELGVTVPAETAQTPPSLPGQILVGGVWTNTKETEKYLLMMGLEALEYDFGDGRIIQTRPQDQQNIEGKIKVIQAGGSDLFVMKDDKPYPVTVVELETAMNYGLTQASALWDVYMAALAQL